MPIFLVKMAFFHSVLPIIEFVFEMADESGLNLLIKKQGILKKEGGGRRKPKTTFGSN